VNGTSTLNGTSNINTTGSASTTLGNSNSVVNLNGGTNNIGTNGASTNNIGTGSSATSTSLGNTQAGTLVVARAGTAATSLTNNLAVVSVTSGSNVYGLSVAPTLTDLQGAAVNITGATTTTINGATTTINGTTTTINGTTTTVNGTTTTVNASNVLTLKGVNGTNINTQGDAGNVTVGNAANTTTIQSGTNTLTGVNNNMVATGINNIIGTTQINANQNATTSINTGTSTGVVYVGNALNTTNLNSATNNIGVNGYVTANNIGTGAAASTNTIGNAVAATQVNARAGTAQMQLANNSASLTVPSGFGGVNNGAAVSATQTVLTGGDASPTRMVLNDSGATFSRASDNTPITVTGVADGRNDFDAVNVRQFAGAIASVTAQANIPPLAAGQNANVGVGVGSFMGKSALSMGVVHQVQKGPTLKFSVAGGLDEGGQTPTVGLGAGWSW